MIEEIEYKMHVSEIISNEEYLTLSDEAYRYSVKINYPHGIARTSFLKGLAFGYLGEQDSSRFYLLQSLRLVEEDDTLISRVKLHLGIMEFGNGNYRRSVQYLDEAMETAASNNDVTVQVDIYNRYAELYKVTGRYSEEEQSYYRILELQDANGINPAKTLISLSIYYIKHGEYREGIRYSLKADSALATFQNVNILEYHDREFMQAKMKGNVARAYRLWGYYDSALIWHRRAITGMQTASIESNVDIPNQWEGIGYVYTQKGIYDSAKLYLEKSARAREEFRDFLGAGESFDGLGYLCWLIGDEEGAVNDYLRAVELKSRQPQEALYRKITQKETQSVTYLLLGQAYASWGMNVSAVENLNKSLALCREIGYNKGEAEALTVLGRLRSSGHRFDAEKDINDALRIFTEIDYKPGQAEAIISMGGLFYAAGEFDKAIAYFTRAEHILQQTQNPIMLTDVWTDIGLTLAEMGENSASENYLQKALNQAKKFNLFRRSMKINKALADVCSKSGKAALALDYYSDFLVKRDSINRQRTYFLLAELQSRHEADLKERQLELLGKENQVKELDLARSNGMMMGIFGLIFLLIFLSFTIYRTLRLKESQREALLQQKLFRARMSTGFINHSLGNVKKLVMESKSVQASDYITYFSRMMQHLLEGSRQELVVFSKGLSMLKSYFELAKLGQDGWFDYEIEIDPQIDQDETMVPSFLEDVITPAYRAETGQRFVKIVFTGKKKKIGICVESRGIVASMPGLSDQELESLMMIRSRLAEMGKKFRITLDFSIRDLKDHEGNPEGKRLDFEVPALYD